MNASEGVPLQEINISHPWEKEYKSSSKMPYEGDMLVPLEGKLNSGLFFKKDFLVFFRESVGGVVQER